MKHFLADNWDRDQAVNLRWSMAGASAITLTLTASGTTGQIDESVYTGSADTGSNFRISSCQYIYNLSASALGVGTYSVDILIDDQVVGSAAFGLR